MRESVCPQIQIADLTANSSRNALLAVTASEPYASPLQVSPSSPFEMNESAVAESQKRRTVDKRRQKIPVLRSRLAGIVDHS
jgi:hypothetical protein